MTLQNAFGNLSTEAKQDAIVTALGTLLTELAQKLEPADVAALATAAKQDTAAGKLDTLHTDLGTLATQTTAAAILAKLTADPATQTTLEAIRVLLAGTLTVGLPTGAATQTTLASVLAKLTSDPATQTTLASVLTALQGTLTVGLPSGAATAANQTTLNAKDFSTETSLAALSAKLPAAVALADAIANPTLTRAASFLHGYNGSTWDRLRSDTTNGLDVDVTRVGAAATASTSATISTNGGVVGPLAVAGMATAWWLVTAAGTQTVQLEASPDNVTFYALLIERADAPATVGGSIANPGLGQVWSAAIPAWASHVRLRTTAYTSNSTYTLAASAVPSTNVFATINGTPSVNSTVIAGAAQIGFVQSASLWADETSTPLTGASTFTGASRDLFNITTGAASASAAARGVKEFRASAVADVAGTLYVEISADGSTWYRVKQSVLAAAPTLFYGELIVRPSARFARAAFVNGAGAQATFRVFTALIGN